MKKSTQAVEYITDKCSASYGGAMLTRCRIGTTMAMAIVLMSVVWPLISGLNSFTSEF